MNANVCVCESERDVFSMHPQNKMLTPVVGVNIRSHNKCMRACACILMSINESELCQRMQSTFYKELQQSH